MTAKATLKTGTRVKLTGELVGVTLRDQHGSVVRPDTYDGYYVVRLDAPAIYRHPDGSCEDLDEVVEALDNLTVLTPPS